MLAPAELVARAAAVGVATLAVTDHDTMAGVPEALAAGAALGVRVVPGIEVSVKAPSGSMHLLGYFAAAAPQPLGGELEAFSARREHRARRIVARLGQAGVPVPFADVAARAGGPIGRPHLAEALVAAGHVVDCQEAFDRFLADGGPCWIPHEGLSPEAAVRLVAGWGGAPVLAHPATLRLGARHLESFVQHLAAVGLVGIEVHRPEHTPDQHAAYAALARRHRLVPTGGSDFHGRPGDPEPGDSGWPPLPEGTLDRLLGAAATVAG